MKKRELDEEIFKFYEVYRESRTVKSLELFRELTGQHLAKLMQEFLTVTQEITELEAQLKEK
jgi:5-carboxymethyl-2-hydroxymuconate isomerase